MDLSKDLSSIPSMPIVGLEIDHGLALGHKSMQVHDEGRSLSPQEFDLAIAYARSYGKDLERQVPSLGNSIATQNAIILRDTGGNDIYRINRILFDQPATSRTDQARASKTDQAKAIAWARSLGYPVPRELNGCLGVALIMIGLLIFVIPGVAIIIWVTYQRHTYQRDIDALVARWVDAGKPEPGMKSNVADKLEMIRTSDSTTTKLEDYAKMLERGLISPEEHDALRKKALGL